MTIELVEKKDCVSNGDRNGKGRVGGRRGGRRIMFKRIDNRDRKKCHKCGGDNGLWYEQFLRGRSVYHYLCHSCINDIESGKG